MRTTTCIGLVILLPVFILGPQPHTSRATDELTVKILAKPTVGSSKGPALLIIQTEVGAMCLGTIFLEANPNQRAKLRAKNADREGKITWKWPVETKNAQGRWRTNLQCATETKSERVSETFDLSQ